MTKKLVLAAVLMLSIVMVSCTTKPTDTTNSNSTTVDQGTQNKDSSKEVEKPKEEPKVNKIKLSIYSIDENSLEPNESGTIEVNENASVEDKLKTLAKELSEKKFDKLSIEVKSIDKVDGKKVATINLVDSDAKKWVPKFQGSTGGAITANTLIENFLQSNNKNKGEWVDGVKFLYNNKPIEYEHVADLATTHYKN
ncbi:hypothetical protein [Clostridium sp. C2-6-12]|uniref:hypothetical protein n=1 Tax=Clostridium sp. C2-6-12 TaxID=2698832 RepID=UPI001370C1BA|nr:hypothetical protein [Clostridium sp. C2-6-12]